MSQELDLGERPPAVAGEVDEELPLRRGQRKRTPGATGRAGPLVHEQVAHLDRLGLQRPGPAQQGAHPGQELIEVEGLDDVVVAARIEAGEAVAAGIAGSEEEDGQVPRPAQSPGEREPVGARQHDVEDGEVGTELLEL